MTFTLVDVKMLLGTILITRPTCSWVEKRQRLPLGQSGPRVKKQVLAGSSVVTCPFVEERERQCNYASGFTKKNDCSNSISSPKAPEYGLQIWTQFLWTPVSFGVLCFKHLKVSMDRAKRQHMETLETQQKINQYLESMLKQ